MAPSPAQPQQDRTAGPLVDYSHAAHRYRRGRSMDPEELEAWRGAVLPHLPVAQPDVLDLGCGTGVFSGAWSAWGARTVVALDPSRSMQSHLDPSTATVHAVTADGHALPLRAGSVDVVWCSAVVHHLADPVAALVDVHRVLRPGGRLLVRELCPDRSEPAWLAAFPGADRARSRFPTVAELGRWAAKAGLVPGDADGVRAGSGGTCAEAAAWAESMRSADSLLTALTDAEVEAGLATLRATPDRRLPPLSLTLLPCTRPER